MGNLRTQRYAKRYLTTFVVVVFCVTGFVIFGVLAFKSQDTPVTPVGQDAGLMQPVQESPFQWELDKKDWTKETTHVSEAMSTLKQVDRAVAELKQLQTVVYLMHKEKVITSQEFVQMQTELYKAIAKMLDTRTTVLMIIHNLTPPTYDYDQE